MGNDTSALVDKRSLKRLFCIVLAVTLTSATMALAAPSALAGPRISNFAVVAHEQNGTIDARAGSHPYEYTISFDIDEGADASIRGFGIRLPTGLTANPQAVPRCSRQQFEGTTPSCSGDTQVGVVLADIEGLGEVHLPVYNVGGTLGVAATLGFGAASVTGLEVAQVKGDGKGVEIWVPAPSPGITTVSETLWGVPADPGHDESRRCFDSAGNVIEGCVSEVNPASFLTLPAACSEPLKTELQIALGDGGLVTATSLSRDAGGNPAPLTNCQSLAFSPQFLGALDTPAADSPTGLSFVLKRPAENGGRAIAEAAIASARIELPDGLVIDPAVAAGLESCPATAVVCPTASKLGTASAETPLLDHRLEGGIYLATPGETSSGSLFSAYVELEDEESGTKIKLPIEIDADSSSGRLTATLDDLPQLPYEELHLSFRGGPRSVFSTPSVCGSYPIVSHLVPSTAPEGTPVDRRLSMQIVGPGGGSCPTSEAGLPAAASFSAGTVVPTAGRSSGLAVKVSREDGSQRLRSFAVTFPPGLLARVGGVATCGEAQIPACPGASQVGTALVKAGAGSSPLALEGDVYLAGPYKGAPSSLVVVVPGQAGPFDLGDVVVRVALDVDVATGQIRAVSDPLPQILSGVPLDLRSISLDLDRPGFIRNPTSCEPMAIMGSATTSHGGVVPLSQRFQVGECAALPFDPKLSLQFAGALGRNGHPSLQAALRGDPEDAAPESAAFSLPAGELVDLRHLRGLCPGGVAAERCPKSSRLGSLRIETPALDEPLEGPVYLRVPSHRLPDLSVELHSGQLEFVLQGRTTDAQGRFGVSLGGIPDVPISEAVLSLPGGRNGIIVNSRSLCSAPRGVTASFAAHSGKHLRTRVRASVEGHCRVRERRLPPEN